MAIVKRIILPAIAAVVFTGCATQAQQTGKSLEEAVKVHNDCDSTINSSEIGKQMSSKILATASASNRLELLSSTRFIDDGEKAILLGYYKAQSRCRSLVLEAAPPAVAAIAKDFYTNSDLVYSMLFKGELNIGDFNRRIQISREKVDNDIRTLWSQLNVEHQAEQAQSSRIWAAIGQAIQKSGENQENYNRQMALARERNRFQETTTTCTPNGNQVSCTTR